MSSDNIVKSWYFKSSSSDKEYETLQYDDGHTSCGCPGWCMKKANKERECKHTRAVEAGYADTQCTRIGIDRTQGRIPAVREQVSLRGKVEAPETVTRIKARKIIM
jgi:predicted nucleic acid-binding Zn finger protein